MTPIDVDAKTAAKLTGNASSILEKKGGVVHSIGPNESVYAAVIKLREYQVGALCVMDGVKLVGVISERDYARKIILEGRASKGTRVEEIMSAPVLWIEPATPLSDCMRLMSDRHVRHLPVMEAGSVIGMISIGDLVRAIIVQQEQLIEQLSALIQDPYPA